MPLLPLMATTYILSFFLSYFISYYSRWACQFDVKLSLIRSMQWIEIKYLVLVVHDWSVGLLWVQCKAATNPKSAYNFSNPWAILALTKTGAINKALKYYKAKCVCAPDASSRAEINASMHAWYLKCSGHLPHTKLAIISANAIHIGRAYPSMTRLRAC